MAGSVQDFKCKLDLIGGSGVGILVAVSAISNVSREVAQDCGAATEGVAGPFCVAGHSPADSCRATLCVFPHLQMIPRTRIAVSCLIFVMLTALKDQNRMEDFTTLDEQVIPKVLEHAITISSGKKISQLELTVAI